MREISSVLDAGHRRRRRLRHLGRMIPYLNIYNQYINYHSCSTRGSIPMTTEDPGSTTAHSTVALIQRILRSHQLHELCQETIRVSPLHLRLNLPGIKPNFPLWLHSQSSQPLSKYLLLQLVPSSPLSNYASKNLAFNEKEVHAQNTSNLDIITQEPKRYDQSIKQYPKFSLEDKD